MLQSTSYEGSLRLDAAELFGMGWLTLPLLETRVLPVEKILLAQLVLGPM